MQREHPDACSSADDAVTVAIPVAMSVGSYDEVCGRCGGNLRGFVRGGAPPGCNGPVDGIQLLQKQRGDRLDAGGCIGNIVCGHCWLSFADLVYGRRAAARSENDAGAVAQMAGLVGRRSGSSSERGFAPSESMRRIPKRR